MKPTRRRWRPGAWRGLTSAFAVGGLLGCSVLLPAKKSLVEQRNPSHPGAKYKVIVVIAGDDTRPGLRMSAMVRQELQDGGWQGVRRSGRWESETEALADICPTGEAVSIDGVLFVYYNQLTLIDCRARAPAYSVQGGDDVGIEGMVKYLMAYLRSEPARPPSSAAPTGSHWLASR